MPPVNPGSRGGLITAVVIFAILWVTATIFAIYYGTQAAKVQEDFTTLEGEIRPNIVADTSPTNPVLNALDEARKSGAIPGVSAQTPLLQVATAQRDQLAQVVAGADAAGAPAAIADATTALRTAAERGGVTLPNPTGDLAGAVVLMANELATRQENAKRLEDDRKALQDQLAASVNANEAELTSKDAEIARIRAEAEQAVAASQTASNSTRESVQTIEQAREEERQKVQVAVDTFNGQIAQLNQEKGELQKENEALKNKLSGIRVNPNEPTLRTADGQLVSIPGNGVVYVDLGTGDQVVPGLTFEVYDRLEGMPRSGDTDEAGDPILPKGKASIEITRVGGSSSEARVIRQETGVILTQGDLIANIVYDRNVKYKFVVFGDFDLDQNEVATAQDSEMIRRLITQWGGELQERVTAETDFVVIGVEPEPLQFTPEERQDPLNEAKRIARDQQIEQYLEVVGRAQALNIPVLNQNRFLYFVGYYNQAGR